MNSYYLDATQVAPPARVASPIQEASAWRDSVLPIGFLVLHIPLALAIHASSMVATIHGCVVMIAGLLVISAPSKTERVAYICAYVAGSELLWRMGKSSLFWETGKYAVALLLLMAIVRSGRGRSTALPMLYFALLVPSTVMMLSTAEGFADARNELSFNLSGPLALTVSAWFFARLSIRRTDMYWLWFALLGPIVGVAFLALFGIATAENFKVAGSSASNAMAAGGYGPNRSPRCSGSERCFACSTS